jgi:hypothetical protein
MQPPHSHAATSTHLIRTIPCYFQRHILMKQVPISKVVRVVGLARGRLVGVVGLARGRLVGVLVWYGGVLFVF